MFLNGFYTKDIHQDEILAPCIHLYKNIWKNTDEVISFLENEIKNTEEIDWKQSLEVEHNNNLLEKNQNRTNYGISLSMLANQNKNLQDLYNNFYFTLLNTSIPYATKYKISSLFHEEYNILKYSGGQEYKAHYDGSTLTGRAISAILYLNDDYLGGELEFPFFDLKIKPEAGSLFLFPSNYPYAHIAHPVIEGTKYAIVTWILDRDTNDEINY